MIRDGSCGAYCNCTALAFLYVVTIELCIYSMSRILAGICLVTTKAQDNDNADGQRFGQIQLSRDLSG